MLTGWLESTERFCEERYREKHVHPDKRKCDYWYDLSFHFIGAG